MLIPVSGASMTLIRSLSCTSGFIGEHIGTARRPGRAINGIMHRSKQRVWLHAFSVAARGRTMKRSSNRGLTTAELRAAGYRCQLLKRPQHRRIIICASGAPSLGIAGQDATSM